MITTKYEPGKPHDDMLPIIVDTVKNSLNNDDDFTIMCFGTRGSGKSSLTMWFYEQFDEENMTADQIGFDKETFSEALVNAKKKDKKRFVCNDEANFSKRRHATKWNNELLDLYYAIRGLRMFHWWNNPSLEMLDKPFIEDIIKGFILVDGKGEVARKYFYFTKKDLLSIFDRAGNLKLKTLLKNKTSCYYQGWFTKYEGGVWDEYMKKKNDRMEDKIEKFWQQFGSEKTYSQNEAAEKIGVSRTTIMRHMNDLQRGSELIPGTHFGVKPGGQKMIKPEGLEIIRDSILEKSSTNPIPLTP